MHKYGLLPATPVLGLWPLVDSVGLKVAIAVLDRSLDKGVHEDTIQWDIPTANVHCDKNHAGSGWQIGKPSRSLQTKMNVGSNMVSHQLWFSDSPTIVYTLYEWDS
jgi:hypothetical protein